MRSHCPSLVEGKPLADILLSRVMVNNEHPVSQDDKERFTYVFILWTRVLQDLSKSYHLERCFTDANLSHWIDRPVIDVALISDELSEITGVIRDYDPVMGRPGFRSYKEWLRERLSCNSCYKLLKPLIFRLYGGDWTVFRDLNTITQFIQRMTFVDTSFMDQDQIDSYLSLEESMRSWEYPETTLDCLRFIVTRWFRDFELDGLQPYFSNGATRETRRGEGVSSKVFKGVRTIPLVLADTLISYDSPYYKDCFSLSEKPRAVFQTVPKSIKKRRGISFEPVVHQYYQSALFLGFKAYFETHPSIGVRLEDQDTSRNLALEGSFDCSYSTIDLSSASDTVTWKLVKEIFRDLPDILRYMEYTRTEAVEIDGQVVKMEKYAPMGSTMCFPMECTVFAAIASYACHLSGIPQLYRVYGDDIVIDSRAYGACCDLLKDLHFSVNQDKSFGPTSHFLEACGIECYRGHDVTPCRISRRFDIKRIERLSPQQLSGTIDVINRLYAYGLFSARRMLVKDILAVYQSVPFSVNPAKGIYAPFPCNTHLKQRYRHSEVLGDYCPQQLEYLVTVSTSETKCGNENVRYVRTLEAIEERESLDVDSLVQVRCGLTRSLLRKKWVSSLELL